MQVPEREELLADGDASVFKYVQKVWVARGNTVKSDHLRRVWDSTYM